ncbi:MAG TPA: ComEC/Rec2 family competence protein [Fimbriimonadales bacterium]|nr:ComEC/Rec2 family competence protein [Fimbriimonadales bacterium]
MWTAFDRRYRHLTSRPFVASTPFLVAGILAPISAWGFLLLLPGLLVGRRWMALGAALFAMGFVRQISAPLLPPPIETSDQVIVGRIASTPNLALGSQRALLEVGDRKLLLYESPQRPIMSGDWVRVHSKVRDIPAPQNAYWHRRGIAQMVDARYGGDLEILAPGEGPATWGSIWREDMWSRLRRNLRPNTAGIAMGVIAGQQDLVDKSLIDAMMRTGTLHLLATSGFNVLILAAGLMVLLSHFPISRSVQIAIAMVILVSYADAVGGRPPVMRAAVMAAVYLGSFLFGRSTDLLSSLGLAAAIYLIAEPGAIFDAGFQLSFATVFGLGLFCPGAFALTRKFLAKRVRTGGPLFTANWIAAALVTSCVAQVVSAPLIAAHFGIVSIIAPIANILTSLAVPMIYLGAAAAQLFDKFAPSVGRGFDVLVTGPFAGWVEWVNGAMGSLSWSAIDTGPVSAWVAGAALVGLLLLSRPQKRDLSLPEELPLQS